MRVLKGLKHVLLNKRVTVSCLSVWSHFLRVLIPWSTSCFSPPATTLSKASPTWSRQRSVEIAQPCSTLLRLIRQEWILERKGTSLFAGSGNAFLVCLLAISWEGPVFLYSLKNALSILELEDQDQTILVFGYRLNQTIGVDKSENDDLYMPDHQANSPLKPQSWYFTVCYYC